MFKQEQSLNRSEKTVPPQAIQSPSPRAMGEVVGCTMWTQASLIYDCATILDLYDLTLDQFYAFNPSAKLDCTGLNSGTYYCISTETNGQLLPLADTDLLPESSSSTSSVNATVSVTDLPATTTPGSVVTPTPYPVSDYN